MKPYCMLLIAVANVGAEEERLGRYPDTDTVYCECSINVVLKGDQRDLTFGTAPACPYPNKPDKVYDPFTHQLNDNGTYTCGVKGGHCIDITYYDPGPGELLEDNTTYCHSRDCATMVKRFRGCVSSDAFIQEVYIDRKGDGNASNGTQTKRSREEMAKLVALMEYSDPHFPAPQSVCHGAYGSPPEFNGSYFIYNEWSQWGISHVPLEGDCQPLCAPQNSTNEKARCREKDNHCRWSRIYCCDETNCNTDAGLKRKYNGFNYNEWMTNIETSMRKVRAIKFSSAKTNAPVVVALLAIFMMS